MTTDPTAEPDRWLAGMRTAPVLVLVWTAPGAYLDRYAEPDKGWTDRDPARWTAPYWYVDAGMAVLAMLYAAVDEGLGACFFGVPPDRIAAVADDVRGSRRSGTRRCGQSRGCRRLARQGHGENVDRRTNWSTAVTGDEGHTPFRDDFGPCRSDRYDSVTGGLIWRSRPLTSIVRALPDPDQGAHVRKIIPVVAAGATALAVAGTTFAYAALNNDVTLAVDGQTSEVTTMNRTVGDVLAGQGITVGAHDVVAPSLDASVADGTKIAVQYGRQVTVKVDGQPKTFWTTATSVDQALQSLQLDTTGADLSTSRSAGIGRQGLNLTVNTAKTVTIEAAGKDKKIETTALTVGEALTEAGIAVDSDDKVSTKESTKLKDGLEFTVTKVDVKTVTKTKKVGYDTVYKNTDYLDKGKTKVDTEGKNGERTVVYREVRHDGKMVKQTKKSSKITRKSTDKVVLVGTKEDEVSLQRRQHRRQLGLGPARPVRVRRQLVHQHRQRLLRRPAVHRLAPGTRWVAAGCRTRPAARPRSPSPRSSRRAPAGASGRAARPSSACAERRAHPDRLRPGPADPRVGLLSASAVRRLATRLDLRPTKQRGQNFVTDGNTVRRIVSVAGVRSDDVVLEIGPGLGSLTLGLLEAADRVVAVEIDPLLAGALPDTVAEYAPGRVDALTVVEADALRITTLPYEPTRVVANLPYNVSVPVLLHLLATFPGWQHGLVMVQAEVADRLAAGPGSKTYGIPSVKMAWYAATTRVGTVPPSVFWPVPNVDSGLVSIVRRPAPGDHGHPCAGVRRGRRRLRPATQDAAVRAGRSGRVLGRGHGGAGGRGGRSAGPW